MMLKFHPRHLDGSSASVSCTDPGCSERASSMSKINSLIEKKRHLSTSSSQSKARKDGRNAPVRSSLPARGKFEMTLSVKLLLNWSLICLFSPYFQAFTLGRKSTSSRRSSGSSSCHSLQLGKAPIPAESQDDPRTEENIAPPGSLSSSISELPEDRKESDVNSPVDLNVSPQPSTSPLTSIQESDELKSLPTRHQEDATSLSRSNTQTYPTVKRTDK